MFNFKNLGNKTPSKEAIETVQAPVQEAGNRKVVIGSVKHLMAASQVIPMIAKAQEVTKSAAIEEPKEKFKVAINQTQEAIQSPITAIAEETVELKSPEFKPFEPINYAVQEPEAKAFVEQAVEETSSVEPLPKHVSTWFIKNLSKYMNGQAVENEADFFELMRRLVDDEDLNPTVSHTGLHKIKHFIKKSMSHIFDPNHDEFITFNLPALDEGIMLMGPTPDNNIVLAGNLSSLQAPQWDSLKQSLESQVN